jgi:hypothetical protein
MDAFSGSVAEFEIGEIINGQTTGVYKVSAAGRVVS